MEKDDKGCPMMRMGVSECFFLYRPTWVVPDQRPLNGCVCVCVCARARARARVCVASMWTHRIRGSLGVSESAPKRHLHIDIAVFAWPNHVPNRKIDLKQ